VLHKWAYAGGEGILGAMWLGNPMKVVLFKATWVPNYDVPMSYSALAGAQEVAGAGYAAGGLALTGKSAPYNAGADRTDLQAADSSWGPGATFQAGFAVIYDDSSPTKLIWSVVDFEGIKSVDNGVFTIDWSAVGLLYILPAS
jgi:hypothetical protein